LPDKDLKLKRKRCVKSSDLDNALVEYINGCLEKRVALSRQLIQKQAECFSDLLDTPSSQRVSFSQGWMEKFVARHGLRTVRADLLIYMPLNSQSLRYSKLSVIMNLANVFNMDEADFSIVWGLTRQLLLVKLRA
jgi:hypothetical protein